ncbi:MAG: hypothetical protein ACI90V_006073 [Bacillariaceae sp.]|jgi:hypothetical protein
MTSTTLLEKTTATTTLCRRLMLGLFAAITVFVSSAAAASANKDTVLDEQFCQKYYTLDDDNCPSLRSTIRSEIRGNGTPTLELGNKDTQKAMVLLHGWPDTSALWAVSIYT